MPHVAALWVLFIRHSLRKTSLYFLFTMPLSPRFFFQLCSSISQIKLSGLLLLLFWDFSTKWVIKQNLLLVHTDWLNSSFPTLLSTTDCIDVRKVVSWFPILFQTGAKTSGEIFNERRCTERNGSAKLIGFSLNISFLTRSTVLTINHHSWST